MGVSNNGDYDFFQSVVDGEKINFKGIYSRRRSMKKLPT
jgi:hypothetical protein